MIELCVHKVFRQLTPHPSFFSCEDCNHALVGAGVVIVHCLSSHESAGGMSARFSLYQMMRYLLDLLS